MSKGSPSETPIDALLEKGMRLLFSPARSTSVKKEPAPNEGLIQRSKEGYRVLGVIARGGMGTILRGRDAEVGRDVAIKVLREDLAGNRAAIRRFVEEARISGRLQHPGIVPVYELGGIDSDRPYFAMKLIEGETLASLLSKRRSTEDELGRFLSIFGAICQTVSFAHSRSIIHRDLKPQNIMVGAFGEVQVVDWGLAKTLTRVSGEPTSGPEPETGPESGNEATIEGPRSIAGAMMGTPAYMPPEQARGEVERVDARSDVFALGGILCEILTGRPPYVGEEAESRRAAAEARIDDALSRLDGCGASPDLVALARRCLAPTRENRPNDAGKLAQAISAHQADLADRARRAEIAAAESRVKAAEEHRARNLTIGLASTVIVAIVIAAGAWVWIRRDAESRRTEIAGRTEASLETATLAWGRAGTSGVEADWEEALAAVSRAEALADPRGAGEELARRTRTLAVRIRGEADDARRRSAIERSNQELLAALRDVRVPRGDRSYPTDWSRLDQEYEAIFRRSGLDAEALPTEVAAAEISGRGLAVVIADSLDAWSAARRSAGQNQGARRLMDLALALDPEPTRSRLRHLIDRGDKSELVRFARGERLEDLSAPTLTLLAEALHRLEAWEESLAVYEIAHRLFPDDFVIDFNFADQLTGMDVERSEQAIAVFHAAVALRPGNVQARHGLGWALHNSLKDPAGAAEVFRDVVRVSPQDAHIHAHLGRALMDAGNLRAACNSLREAIRIDPNEGSVHAFYGEALRLQGDIEGCMREEMEALRIRPDDSFALGFLGRARLALGDRAGAISAMRDASKASPSAWLVRVELAAALLADGDAEGARAFTLAAVNLNPASVLDLYERGLDVREAVTAAGGRERYRELARTDPLSPDWRCCLGLALLEEGRPTEALLEFQAGDALSPRYRAWGHPSAEWVRLTRERVEAGPERR